MGLELPVSLPLSSHREVLSRSVVVFFQSAVSFQHDVDVLVSMISYFQDDVFERSRLFFV